jgi:DNA-binding NarL/FixJ family response regulator
MSHGFPMQRLLACQSMSIPILVGIVEDDDGFRRTLQRVFDSAADFRVAAACANAESALQQIPAAQCQLVMMDIGLPGMSGIDCLRNLKSLVPGLQVVMLTAFDDNDNLFHSLVAGADGYLLKRCDRDRLLEAVREIASGGAPISPQMARRMIEYFHHFKGAEPALPPAVSDGVIQCLTGREQEVLALLAKGFTPKEVASELNISWQTVRNFIKSIYDKLHVHNRTDAVLKYLGRVPAADLRRIDPSAH